MRGTNIYRLYRGYKATRPKEKENTNHVRFSLHRFRRFPLLGLALVHTNPSSSLKRGFQTVRLQARGHCQR